MYNPKGFSKGVLLDLPKINAGYDLGALLKKKLHLIYAEVKLKEMVLEKNKQGELNVDQLKVTKEQKNQESKAKSSGQMPMQIDTLRLDIGKIIYKDYSAGAEPIVKAYDINMHKTYKNITSVQQLIALILIESMKETGIKSAKIYGLSLLAGTGGIAIIPAAVATIFTTKDSVQQNLPAGFDKTYAVSYDVLKNMGKVTDENKETGVIAANIDSAQATVKIDKKSFNETSITVSARKFFFPKPEIAKKIIDEISKKLK